MKLKKLILILLISIMAFNCTNVYAEDNSKQLKVGDYVYYKADVESYTISKEDSGYDGNQTIHPNELTLWRIVKIMDDGSMEVVSDRVSSEKVKLYGLVGYNKLVYTLNGIAKQYIDNELVIDARAMGYSNQRDVVDMKASGTGTADEGYKADVALIENTYNTLVAKDISGEETEYYLATREYKNNNGNAIYRVRTIDKNGNMSNIRLTKANNGGNNWIAESSYRPILKMSTDVDITSGDGTENSPYIINRHFYSINKTQKNGTFDVSSETSLNNNKILISNIKANKNYKIKDLKITNNKTGEDVNYSIKERKYLYDDNCYEIYREYQDLLMSKEHLDRIKEIIERHPEDSDIFQSELEMLEQEYNDKKNNYYSKYTDEDYKIAVAKINDINSYENVFIFTMPSADVTVNVEFEPTKYSFIEGQNAVYNNNSLVFKLDGEYSLVDKIKINGKELESSNYELKEGSTIVTLKKSYLDTLGPGTYELEVSYTNGLSDKTNFKIKEKIKEPEEDKNDPTPDKGEDKKDPTPDKGEDKKDPTLDKVEDKKDTTPDKKKEDNISNPIPDKEQEVIINNPKTGDESLLFIILFVISIIGLSITYVFRKKIN